MKVIVKYELFKKIEICLIGRNYAFRDYFLKVVKTSTNETLKSKVKTLYFNS